MPRPGPYISRQPFQIRNVFSPLVARPTQPGIQLYAAGRGGAWYDPSDLSTLFQSGTRAVPGLPVTSDLDPVGLVLDKSGNNNDLIQSTSTKRPLYRSTGGPLRLQFDGVDDCFVSAAALDLSAYGQLGLIIGLKPTSTSTLLPVELGPNTNATPGTFFIAVNNTGVGQLDIAVNGSGIDDVATTSTAYGSGVTSVLSCQNLDVTNADAATRVPLRVNGSSAATTVFADGGLAGTTFSASQSLNVGGRNGSAFFFAGDFFGLIIRGGAFTDAELAYVEGLMISKVSAASATTYNVIISAAVVLAGSASKQLSAVRSISGSVTLFGSVARAVSYLRAISGVVALFASLTKPATHPRAVCASVTTFGSVSRTASFPRQIAGSVAVQGTIARTLSALRSIAGLVTTSGAVSRIRTAPRSISGMVAVPGSATRIYQAVRSIAGVVVLEGQVAVAKAFVRQVAGSVITLGRTTPQKTASRSINGSVVVKASVSRVLSAVRAIVPSPVIVGSAVTRTAALQRTIAGLVGIVGQVQSGKAYGRTVATAVAVSASLQTARVRLVTIGGQVALSASLARQLAAHRLVSGAVGVAASVSRALSSVRLFRGLVATSAGMAMNVTRSRTVAALLVLKGLVIAGAPHPFVPMGAIIRFVRQRLPFRRAAREDRSRKF